MSRRAYGWAAALGGLLVLVAAVWWLRAPRVVEAGEPLPLDQPVEMHFRDAAGEPEVWKLEKKTTTREESVGTVVLPKPDPDAARHQPNESARALDGQALQAWRESDLAGAMKLFAQAVEADPDDRVPRSHYGRLLLLATDFDAAREHLERAAELAPEDPQVWLDLQSLYERTQRLDQSWQARAQAETLAGGRAITQDESGLYKVDGADWGP